MDSISQRFSSIFFLFKPPWYMELTFNSKGDLNCVTDNANI